MSSNMPELGSEISLISKADIRYEGRLFTVDPQECTIALASVRSFGTEDRKTQFPVAPQNQVYDYILFRGTDIKDIRVTNTVQSMPHDPAIMQMSVPPTIGGGAGPPQFPGQFNHPIVGQNQYPQYHPMGGFPGGVHQPMNKPMTADMQQVEMVPQPTAPIGTQPMHHNMQQVKDQGSMLDLLAGGQQQSASRSGTPAQTGQRKSPTTDQGTQAERPQVGSAAGQQRDSRRVNQKQHQPGQQNNARQRTNSRNRQQRYPNQGQPQGPMQGGQGNQGIQSVPHQQAHTSMQNAQHNMHHQQGQGYNRGGGWRGGRARGRGRGFGPRNKNTLKFDNDYDFEQANTEFEELRTQLARAKISDGQEAKIEPSAEVDKKDDSGNETGAGEAEVEDDNAYTYDKAKSFFDNISCEAVERSKGRSQRTDWRTERKLNSETFGVASARRGAWRGRPGWRHHPQHQPWRANSMGRGRGRGEALAPPAYHHQRSHRPAPHHAAPQPQPALAK